MIKSQSTVLLHSRSDAELCQNACGFYGNKIWDGFCSKCYREVYQQAKQIQRTYDEKTPASTSDSPPSFSNFHEKRRTNLNLRNPIRQMVHRAGSLRSSSSSVISALLNDDHHSENEEASKHFEFVSNDEARADIKAQVKAFATSFQKKCSNKASSSDLLGQEYGAFKDAMKKRLQSNAIYQNESEDLIPRIRDYAEQVLFSKNYALIFNRIASECEEQDLAIQNRISSLHWVSPAMLDAVLNESLPNVREAIYKAINALIELDSKSTPQGKIRSIMECKGSIEDALRASSGVTISADCFLPALIYVVLKAKPPRLHSNIHFLSQFSQPCGEELYYLANLDSAVRFIELLQAEHLGLSGTDFSLYMRGEPVLPSKFVSLFDYPCEPNEQTEERRKLADQYEHITHSLEKVHENISDFQKRFSQAIHDIKDLLANSYQRFPCLEEIPERNDHEQSTDTPEGTHLSQSETSAPSQPSANAAS